MINYLHQGRGVTMKKSNVAVVLIVVALALTLASCSPGPGSKYNSDHRAGFFSGIWHGLLSPLFFIIGIFTSSVEIYEPFNSGSWYQLGYLIGISIVLGGGCAKGINKFKGGRGGNC